MSTNPIELAIRQLCDEKSIQYLNGISGSSALYPYALQLRGSAHAILGKNESARRDFSKCISQATRYARLTEEEKVEEGSSRDKILTRRRNEAEDLAARCQAGIARVLYQEGQFEEADKSYDDIPKVSMVWPDILFEQAWNAFSRQEYNRTLGKLVTYKSPALGFVLNSEVDVLRAQAYLLLCLYDDANLVINEFNQKYARVTTEVKDFVEKNANDLATFYAAGVSAYQAKLSTQNDFYRLMNRFVRSPVFRGYILAERALQEEVMRIRGSREAGDRGEGLEGFLEEVASFRMRSIRWLGGAFVKNALIDYHQILLSDFDKISFIKLEMLSRAKDQLLGRVTPTSDRMRGNQKPRRRDDQYYWSFNGEFWSDELGDYVFGLESACEKAPGGRG
jgi:tetratricopeptide (TPR) repeat protein